MRAPAEAMARLALLVAAAAWATGLRGAAAQQGAGRRRKKDLGTGWTLSRHSFEGTLTYDDNLGDWFSNAATMALRDRVQLLPPVPERHGILWHTRAIETRNFELTFTLSFNHKPDVEAEGAGVALWISPENVSAAYNEQAPPGHNYTGLAIVLQGGNAAGSAKRSISAAWNAGKTLFGPTATKGALAKGLDWLSAGTQLKVRVKADGGVIGFVLPTDLSKLAGNVWGWAPDGSSVDRNFTFAAKSKLKWSGGEGKWTALPGGRLVLEFSGQTHLLHMEGSSRAEADVPFGGLYPALILAVPVQDKWSEAFRLAPGSIPASQSRFFIGFSGWSGSKSFLEVNLHRLEATNFDARKVGEEEAELLGADAAAWLEVFEQELRFVSQASQKEAVQRLTKLLSDHVDKYTQMGESIKEDIVRMDGRAEKLGYDIATYLAVGQAWVQEYQRFDPAVVRDHILGVRTVLTRSKEVHDAKSQVVHQAAQDLKAVHSGSQLNEAGRAKVLSVAQQSRDVEAHAARGSLQTNVLLLVMVVAVAGLGLLFLNRMRYYEKKHYI